MPIFRLGTKISNLDDEDNSVPLHRSYGVKKRVTFFTRLNNVLAVVLMLMLIALCGAILVVGVIALTSMLGYIGIFLAMTAVVLFVFFKVLRKPRKRLKFILKLKKRCKEQGFKLEFKRGFFKGLRLNKQGIDFTVDTGKRLWSVRYYTARKYLSHVTFVDKNTLEIRTNITRSHFKFVLGLNNERARCETYSYEDFASMEGRKTTRVLLMNPVPHDVFKKDPDGARIPIGTGEYLYGYTMYSGSGFLEALRRDYE